MAQRAISLPFKFNSNGEVGYTTDYKKMVQDHVIGIIMTLYKERVMTPTFGTAARTAIFETQEEAQYIVTSEVRAGLASWLPEISINKIETSKEETDILKISVYYSLPTETEDSVSIRYGLFSRSGDLLLEGIE